MSRDNDSSILDIRDLVSPDGSRINASIYSDPDVYQAELKNIFAKSWLLLCPESQIPTYGDYFVTYMGEDPVIVVRQKDGSVAAFLNQCRHRGGALCRGESGNSRAFTCSYHGWSYDTKGQLTSVPLEEQLYKKPIDKSQWSARRPRVEIHHGLVLGCWDENAPGFREWLGDAALYFDLNFGRTDAGIEAFGGVYKWRIKANWKMAAEQFASDYYHFFTSHASALAALGVPSDLEIPYVPGVSGTANGHGCGLLTDQATIAGMLEITAGRTFVDYLQNIEQPQAIARYGHDLGSAYPEFANFFPSLGYLHANRTLRTWIPRGPDEMEVWAWTTIDKDAPQEVRVDRRTRTARTFGPTGIFEQDDTANWVDVQRPLSGYVASQTQFNLEMGSSNKSDIWPGSTDIDQSENSSRGFYRRWREMMSADSNSGVVSDGREANDVA